MNDLRLAFRRLMKCSGTSLAAVAALAFGIGVVTLLFSVVNCLLLRPLPFEDSHRLCLLERLHPVSRERCSFWTAEWSTLQEPTQSFETIAGFSWHGQAELAGPGLSPQRYRSSMASASLLEVLRVRPLRGRWFAPDDESLDGRRLVVLSHRVWQRDFLGDESVIGRAVRLGCRSFDNGASIYGGLSLRSSGRRRDHSVHCLGGVFRRVCAGTPGGEDRSHAGAALRIGDEDGNAVQ